MVEKEIDVDPNLDKLAFSRLCSSPDGLDILFLCTGSLKGFYEKSNDPLSNLDESQASPIERPKMFRFLPS